MLPPEFLSNLQSAWIVLVDVLTLFVLLVGLIGLIVPIFPGLVIMWLGTLVYALLQSAADRMTFWDWVLLPLLLLVWSVIRRRVRLVTSHINS